MNRLARRSAVRAFEVFGSLAVILNVVATAVAIKRDLWTMAFGYFLIAAMLAGVLALHWYIRRWQVPYRWRDEGWGLERWREGRRHDEDEDVYGDGAWNDDDDGDRDRY